MEKSYIEARAVVMVSQTVSLVNNRRHNLILNLICFSALKSSLRQKSEELNTSEETLSRLKTERSHVSEIIRQEFADRIVATEEDAKRVRMEMSEMKARHRHEMDKAREDVVRALKVTKEIICPFLLPPSSCPSDF